MTPVPVAVLVSGGGTNLQALLDALRDSAVARVACVVASAAGAGALERARRAGVPTVVLTDPEDPAELVTATGDARRVITDPQAPYYGIEVSERSLTADHATRLGPTRLADWLTQLTHAAAAV